MISEANLSFWIKNHYNVLFRGKHGVGKTATILQAFANHGLKFQYFSASTMDPWVDFIGVPKEKIDENGNSYLDLIRPKHFQEDAVEAIFLDEFNRSSKKVRNAVMELIQFKSINGKKFNNLKIIWAAINPEDDEEGKYDVEALDPAQFDRFHVCVDVPYIPHAPYFRDKYGVAVADVAITWWKELSKEQKNLVSPRRLDYVCDMYSKGGDIKFVLPNNVNTSKLILELSSGSISKKMKTLFETKDEAGSKAFLTVENNYAVSHPYIVKSKEYQAFFLPLLPEEKLIGLMAKHNDIMNYVFNQYDKFESIIKNLATSKSSGLAKRAQQLLKQKQVVVPATIITKGINQGAQINFTKNTVADLKGAKTFQHFTFRNTYDRRKVWDFYNNFMPEFLDEDTAKQAVLDLSNIAESTQLGTIKGHGMATLIGLLNHAVKFFVDSGKPLPIDQRMVKKLSKKHQGFIV